MRRPVFVRPASEDERQQLEAGYRSADAFVLRRCQIILASARGEWAPRIARNLGCGGQAVCNTISAFKESGLLCLRRGSSVPHTMYPSFDSTQAEQLRALLHQSPSSS